jgi:hypothetical protein
MRIAFCLSGQPRFIEPSVRSLINNVLPYNDCDVFIHTWFDPTSDVTFDSAQPTQDGNVGTQNKDTLQILSELKPVSVKHEKQIDFTDYVSGLSGFQTNRMFQMASMFYSASEAHKLAKHSSRTYDIIVRTRLDLIYQKPLRLSVSDLSKMYSAEKWQYVRTEDYSVSDSFMFSSPTNMDVVAEAYDKIRTIHSDVICRTSEHFVGYLLNQKGIETTSYPVDVEIAHRLFRSH